MSGTPPGRVLVLGGTGEARRLATALVDEGVPVLSSLAGRVADPVLPPGDVRVGGFGGSDGLAAWLSAHPVQVIVDATHPFAVAMTASAATAAAATGVPLLRLQRPGWTAEPADDWRWVDSLTGAAEAVRGFGCVFLTTGRQGLAAFATLTAHCVVRSVDPRTRRCRRGPPSSSNAARSASPTSSRSSASTRWRSSSPRTAAAP